jgi:hypothetical protein
MLTSSVIKKTTYVPPSVRKTDQTPVAAKPLSSTKKPALKKEFQDAFNPSAFPSLGDTMKNHKKNNGGTTISFSSAAAAKQVEAPKIAKSDVLPGWVHIRQQQGAIQYKYGAPIDNQQHVERADLIQSKILLKYLIARGQYERDRDVERLGDLSEFYGEPTLAEIYDNDRIAAKQAAEYNDSDYSDSYDDINA